MAFSNFFRSEVSTILIKLKVIRLELHKMQTDIERLLLMDQTAALQEAQQLVKLEKKLAEFQKKEKQKAKT